MQRQQTTVFWKSVELNRTKTIRPDIVIRREDSGETIVVDTKWKFMDDFLPGDDDLKQMFVYNLYWNCKKSVLLYPSLKADERLGAYIDFADRQHRHSVCTVLTANILNEQGQLHNSLGRDLMDVILAPVA